jgi:oxygen-independent coproporphyrinogen-3 oxidase
MLGLGAGARSYTTALHYSTPWKMIARNIKSVVDDYCATALHPPQVTHAFELDVDEQRRRFVILSLLYDGLDVTAFNQCFATDVRELFAEQWDALDAEDCVHFEATTIRLTPRGVRHADVIGQLFFSPRVRTLMDSYEYDS